MPEAENELDRTYVVPLAGAWIAPRYRRTSRAVNVLKEFAERHMKSSEIKIDTKLNDTLWNRGITRPPRKITVRMTKDEDGLVTISLPKAPNEEEEATPAKTQVEDVADAEKEKKAETSGKEEEKTTSKR